MPQPAQSGLDATLAYGVCAKINFDLGSVSLQPELLFAQRMASESLGDAEATSTVSFIMLPILVSYPVTNEISVLLNSAVSGSVETEVSGTDQMEGGTEDIKDLNALEFSVIGGLSYALNENINVGLRYDHMITEFVTKNGSDTQIGAIALNLGYNF